MPAGDWMDLHVTSRNTWQRLRPWLLTAAAVPGYVIGWIAGVLARAGVFLFASIKAGFVDGVGITEGEHATTSE